MMDRLERLQHNYLLLVPELRDKQYTDQLRMMNIQSLERWYDWYRAIYVRKALHGLVPRMGLIEEHDRDHRLGLKVQVPRTKTKLRLESFAVRGPEVFNSLPKELRNETGSMEMFKKKLDEFLYSIPDIQRITAGSSLHSNSLQSQIKGWTWQLRMWWLHLRSVSVMVGCYFFVLCILNYNIVWRLSLFPCHWQKYRPEALGPSP